LISTSEYAWHTQNHYVNSEYFLILGLVLPRYMDF